MRRRSRRSSVASRAQPPAAGECRALTSWSDWWRLCTHPPCSDEAASDAQDPGYETSLPAEVGLALRYGLVDYKDEVLVSRSGNTRSTYNEWEVKLTKDLFGATWGIAYVDTDMSRVECENFLGYDDLCDATAVASVSKSF